MFTAALRPRCYYALTLNQWWCDKLISCAVIVIVLHTFFQALPWQRRWKGLPAQFFFFVIVILFLIAYYLNICLKMKTEINHNRKKDKKNKKKSQLRSIRPQSFSSSSSSDALLLDMNLLWLFKAFFFFSLFWSVWFQHPGQALWEEFSSWLTRLPLCFVGLLIPNDTIFWQWDSTLITCGLSHEDDQLLLLLFSLFLPQSTYSVFLLTL